MFPIFFPRCCAVISVYVLGQNPAVKSASPRVLSQDQVGLREPIPVIIKWSSVAKVAPPAKMYKDLLMPGVG